jgi:formylglycine-generating enzyme required for sulfatase activity
MHLRGKGGAVLREEQVREILSSELSESSLENFLRAVRYRGGLFEERSNFFQFIHLTSQEFLVARLMAKQRDASRPTLNKHVTDSWWREVILLIYGYLQMDYLHAATDYLKWLSNLEDSDEKALAGTELAGSAVLEMEKPEPDARLRQAENLKTLLMNKAINVPGILRGASGRTLARLGDPRFRKDAFELPNDTLLGFVEIPAGNFTMGTKEEDIPALIQKFGGEKDWYKWETEQHQFDLQMFYISRYLITNAQFNVFLEDGGYKEPRYWEEAEIAKVWEEDGYIKDRWRQERRNKPYDYGEPFNLPNHPVVGVTWYEALAYTKWLTEQLRTRSGTPEHLANLLREDKWEITLPTEIQWEKAARGEGGRIFPWEKDEINPNLANYDKTGINTTSAVGCFPGGASFYGVQDLSGNVWE